MLRPLFSFLFSNHYGHLAPGRPSLYDLYWGEFQNRLYDDYDNLLHLPSHSTMTCSTPLWRPSLHHTYDSRPTTILWRRDLLVGYKETILRGMSSECSLFTVLQSEPPSPLISILYFLPKDQTLERVIRQLRSHLTLLNTSHTKQTTLSPYDLVSSLRIAQAPHKRDSSPDDPVVS